MRRMIAIAVGVVIGVSVIHADTFKLKSSKTGKLYGPFESSEGAKVVIGKSEFTVIESRKSDATAGKSNVPMTLKGFVVHCMVNKVPADSVRYRSGGRFVQVGVVEQVKFEGKKDGKEYGFGLSQFKDAASLEEMMPLIKKEDGIVARNGLFVISVGGTGKAADEIIKLFKQY